MEHHEHVVVQVVAGMTGRDAGTITPATRLAEDLGIRSLDRIELLALLEERLGRTLSDREFMLAKTIADVAALASPTAAVPGP
jgi:acyl carrier protein